VRFTYNEIGNDKTETLAAFLGRMMPVVERSEVLVTLRIDFQRLPLTITNGKFEIPDLRTTN